MENTTQQTLASKRENFCLHRNDVVRGLYRIPPSPVLDNVLSAPIFCMAFSMKDKTSIHSLTQRALWAINHVKSFLARGESSPYIENMPGFTIVKGSSEKKKEKWVIMRNEEQHQAPGNLNDQMSVISAAAGCDPLAELKRHLNLHEGTYCEDGHMVEIDVKLRIHEVRRVDKDSGNVGEVCDHYLMLTVQSPLAFSFRRAVYDSLQFQLKKAGENHEFLDQRRRIWNQMRACVKDMLPTVTRVAAQKEEQEETEDGSEAPSGDEDDEDDELDGGSSSSMRKKRVSRASRCSDQSSSKKKKKTAAISMHYNKKQFSEAEVTHGIDINNVDWMRIGEHSGFTCLFSVHKALDWIRNDYFYRGIGGDDTDVFFLEGFGILRRGEVSLRESVIASYCQYDASVENALEQNRKYNDYCRRNQGQQQGSSKKNKKKQREDRFGIHAAAAAMDNASATGVSTIGGSVLSHDNGLSFENGPPVICLYCAPGVQFKILYCDERGGEDKEGVRDDDDDADEDGIKTLLVNGYPQCNVVMGVAVPVRLESTYSLVEFERHVKIFPASVTLDILRVMLALDAQQPSSNTDCDYHFCLSDEDAGEEPQPSRQLMLLADDNSKGKEITFEELQNIVSGCEEEMGRPMLSNGDMGWHDHCIKSVFRGCENESEKQQMKARFDRLKSFVRLALGLSLTRSLGSDSYVNDRVAAYGRFMENDGGNTSQRVCLEDTYFPFLRWKQEMEGRDAARPVIGSRMGDPYQEALCFLGHVVDACNATDLHLYADNVHYFMQLMISDVMLAINFHGGDVKGAANGIGATLIVRDGYGNYRHLFRDNQSRDSFTMTQGQVYSKSYGCGADLVVLKYKNTCVLSKYYPDILGANKEFITEVKRSTEMGLMHNVCNTVEKHGSEYKLVHMVNKTSSRLYSTELKAGNDAQSQSCMQAIAWLIARNTMSGDSNVFKSTREHEKSKARIPVEYKQVIYGYWVLCSNQVAGPCRERFRALAAVCRSVASGCIGPPRSDFMADIAMGWAGSGCMVKQRDKEKRHTMGEEQKMADAALDVPKPLFLSAMCTSIVTAFMQWTGSLGKLPSSYALECLMKCFYSELEMNSCFLNPDISSGGELSRLLQVSKARGVAMSLLGMAVEETIESGRRLDDRWHGDPKFEYEYKKEGHLRAVERCALRLMTSGNTIPSVAPWMMADTMEHLFRLDFMILMQVLCRKFEVPAVGLNLKDLLMWLKTGNFDHCAVLGDWIQKMRVHAVGGSVMCSNGGSSSNDKSHKKHGLTPSQNCMYISHAEGMRCQVGEDSSEFDLCVSVRVGTNLFNEYQSILHPHCFISEQNGGPDIMRGLIFSSANKQYAWPSVFGSIDVLQHFWQRRPPTQGGSLPPTPEMEQIRDSMSLCPLRIMLVEPRVAALAVDVRWLLLIRCLCGGFPCQSSRFALVSRWVQHFYQLNVPDYMKTSNCVWTGMPSPFDRESFISVSVTEARHYLEAGDESEKEGNGGSMYRLMDKYPDSSSMSLHPYSHVQRWGTRCMLKRWGVQKCLNEKILVIGLDAPIGSKVVEDMGPAAPRYEMAKVLGMPERMVPTHAVTSYALPYGVWFPVLLKPTQPSVDYVFASLLVMEEEDQQQSGSRGVSRTLYILNFRGHLIDVTNDSVSSIEEEQCIERSPFLEVKENELKQRKMARGRQKDVDKLIFSARYMTRLVTAENVSVAVECPSSDFGHSKSESCAFGLNGRILVDVRPLCVFFRPGVLLKIENPKCDGCCDQSHYGLVHRYDADRSAYEVMCNSRSIVHFTPYEVEDMVVPMGSVIYVKARAFFVGGSSTRICFYQKKKPKQQQQQLLSPVSMSQLQQQHVVLDQDDVAGDQDVVECKLCIPKEDLQESYVADGWRGNGILSVSVVMFYDSAVCNEIESLYTESSTKDGMKHVRHMSVEIQDTRWIQNPGSFGFRIFDCIGVKPN